MPDYYMEDEGLEKGWNGATWLIIGIVVLTVLGSILLTYQDMPGHQRSATSVAQLTLSAPQTPTATPSPSPQWSEGSSTPIATLSPQWGEGQSEESPTPSATLSPTPSSSPALTPTPTATVEEWPSPTASPTQFLTLPTPWPTRVPIPCGRPPAHWQLYTIKRGDTIQSLARRYRTSVYEIMRANCLGSYIIYVGQRLYLPPPATPTPVPTNTPTAEPTLPPTQTPTAEPTLPLTQTPT
ncbi:MAG: LysM peptidoglycan-binding domain-containing protein, partial [Anaerolineae bacterium]